MSEIAVGIVSLLLMIVVFLTGLELGFAMAVLGFVGFSYVVSMKEPQFRRIRQLVDGIDRTTAPAGADSL